MSGVLVAIILCTSLLTPLRMPDPKQQPPKGGEIEKLGAFVGKWVANGEWRDTQYSKAHSMSSQTICNWMPNHGFLICDQITHKFSETQNDLSIYTYSDKAHAFEFFGVSRNDPEARNTKLTIEGPLWTYSDEEDDGANHVWFRTTNNFTSPSKIIWRSEYFTDGSHRSLMREWTIT